MRSDHVEMRELWKRLRVPPQMLVDEKSAALDATLIERFSTFYRVHIELEETQLFPLARALLDDQALATTGASMAQRRGVKR